MDIRVDKNLDGTFDVRVEREDRRKGLKFFEVLVYIANQVKIHDEAEQVYYVSNNGKEWFVKEGKFFEGQGGLTSEWGKSWRPILATSIDDARVRAAKQMEYGLP